MVKRISFLMAVVLAVATAVLAIELDVDNNGAMDLNKGGTNATSASGARANIGLGNVNNTSDADKPISSAVSAALNLKKGTAEFSAYSTAVQAKLDAKANTSDLGTAAAAATTDFAAAAHNQGASTITSGELDGDRLPAPGAKKGGITGTQAALLPTSAEKAAMTAASLPSADNPFATRADLSFVNYSATGVTVTAGGAATGTVGDTHGANDAEAYEVQEATGLPGYDVRFTFSGAGHFNQVSARIWYNGATNHDLYLQIYNYGSSQWDDLHSSPMHGTTSFAWISFSIPDNTAYVSGGNSQVRFYHSTAGNPAHSLQVDYLALQHSTMGGATTLHSALAGRSGADQHPMSAITGLEDALADTATAAQGAKADNTSADEVFAINYNGGALTSTTINAAITAIGSTVKTLVLTPGDWAMSANITTPSTLTLRLQPGARIVRSSGTLTINGPVQFPVRQCLSGLTSGTLVWGQGVTDIYMVWQAVGDGVTDDYQNIRGLITNAPQGTQVHFGHKLTYVVSSTFAVTHGLVYRGNGSTLVGANGILSTWTQASSNTSQSIAITKDVTTFTIPGGISVAEGQYVKLYGATYITGYNMGHLARITAVSGSTATMDVPPLNTFTATNLEVFNGHYGAKFYDLTFDNRTATTVITSLNFFGSDSEFVNCRFIGADNAGIGLSVTGNNIRIENVFADGYLDKIGIEGTSGRTGYGIFAAGNNISIDKCTVKEGKHGIALGADRYFISNNISVTNSTLWQNPAHYDETFEAEGYTFPYYSTVLDAHANIEQWEARNNTITGASVVGVISVRNGKGSITGNTIRQANTNTDSNIIIIGERTLTQLDLSGNTITADTASIPLMRDAGGNVLDWIGAVSPFSTATALKDIGNEYTNVTHNLPYFLSNTAYDATSWNGDITTAPTKDAVRDKIEAMTGSFGEANTASNLVADSASSKGLFAQKSVVDLQFKNIKAGTNVTLSADANEVTINSSGTGDVVGPASSGDNEVVRFDSTTGKLVQRSSNVTVSDIGTITTAQTDQSVEIVAQNSSATAGKFPKLIVRNYDGAGYGGFASVQVQSARGTSGTPVASANNDTLASILGYGYGSVAAGGGGSGAAGFKTAGALQFFSAGAFTDDDQPAHFVVALGKVGGNGSTIERLRVETGGGVSIPAGGAASAATDKMKIWNVEGDYLHVLDEDGNDHTIGQGAINVGDTAQSTVNASKLGGQAGSYYAPLNGATHAQGTSTTLDLNANDGFRITAASGAVNLTVNNLVDGKYFDIEIISSSGALTLNAPLFTGATFLNGNNSTTVSAGKKSHYVCKGNGSSTALCYILAESKP